MKRTLHQLHFILFAVFCCFMLQNTAIGQITVQIGTGTDLPGNTLYGPVYRYTATSTTSAARCNILYSAAEMATAGIPVGATITHVEFNKGNVANFVTPANLTMYMANTSNTALATTLTWASVLTTHTQVYTNSAFNMPSAAGWVSWALPVPFTYTGGALEIATDLTMAGNGGATDMFKWEYTSGKADHIVGVSSAGATLNGTVAGYKERPNIKITYIGTLPCNSPPTPGNAFLTPSAPFCQGTNAILNVNGNTTGTGQTYQWQRSISATGPFTNFGSSSTSSLLNITASQDSFYRCEVTCNGQFDYTTPVQTLINPGISGTFTINSAFPTGGTNFQTYTEAVDAMKCGITGPITFIVDPASGPYTEQVVIPQINGASATNRITFDGNGTTVQFAPVTANRHIIKLDGADYVTLKNINVLELASAFAYGIHLMNDANFDSIVNCRIDLSANTAVTATQYAGIVASGAATSPTTAGNAANNLVISGCTIIGGYYGISLVGPNATGVRCTQNQIINNTIKDFYSIGTQIINNDSCIIRGNDISRPGLAAVTTFEGIELAGGNKRAIISNNRIHDTHNSATTQTGGAYGIYCSANDAPLDSANLIYNNIIYNFNSTSGVIYPLYNSNSDGAYYYHNTIAIDQPSASAGATYGFYQSGAATDIEIKNNLIYINRGGSGAKRCLHFATSTSSIISESNNLFVVTGSSGTGVQEIGYYVSSYPTLAAWQTANSNAYDQLSKSATPVFADISTADYTSTAPLLNNAFARIAIVPSDINGVLRGSFTEPGAYEYVPGACSTPIAGTATTSVVLPPCAGSSFTVDLIGNSVNTGQTYQWESSPSIGGTYTPIGGLQNIPILQSSASAQTYYRCIVTCAATSVSDISVPVEINIAPALSAGTYTIDPTLPASSSNFQSITSAVNALNCGVSGSVIFDIAAGTYIERADISTMLSNPSDSIVFQSAGGSASLVTIQWPSSATVANNSIFNITNSRHIYFKNITFERTGALAYATIFALDSTTGIRFINNTFIANAYTATNTTGTQSHIFSDDTKTEDSTVIIGNTFTGNSNAVFLFSNIDRPSEGTIIQQNTMTNTYYGVFLKHHNNVTVANNTIQRSGTGAFDYYGMTLENCDSAVNVFNNTISSPRGYGIRLLGSNGTPADHNKVYNNIINLDQATGTSLAYGFSIESSAAYNTMYTDIFHNTVSVKSGSATTGRAVNFAGVAASQGNNITLTNNILVNSGSGYIYYIPANALSTDNKFDRNNLYSAGNNIGTWGSTTGIPFNQNTWIATTGMDSLSSYVPVNFVSATDLHLAGSSIGDFNLATDITNLTSADIEGNLRTGPYYYKGAYEASTPLTLPTIGDAGIWSIDTPGSRLSITGNTDIIVTLRNNGLVPLTSLNINYSLNSIVNAPYTWSGSLAPGKTTTVNIGTIFLPTGSNAISAWTENTNGSGDDLIKTNDTAKAVTITAPPLDGPYSVGPGLDFANLTAVANALKTRMVTNHVVFELDQSYTSATETFPITFSSPTKASEFSVTIRPSSSATSIITEGVPASSAHLIVLDSTIGLTFDGRAGGNGTTSQWIIRNKQTTTTYGATIRLVDGAQYNTFKYLTIEGQQTTTTTGLIVFSTTTQDQGNSFNTVDHCILRNRSDVAGNGAVYAIYCSGTAANRNANNTISNNEIYNFTTNGVHLTATGSGGGWRITDNQFYYNNTTTPVTTTTHSIINILAGTGADGFTISGNYIGGSAPNCGGSPWTNSSNTAFVGISLESDSTAYSYIHNNTIANIVKTGTGAAAFSGIRTTKTKAKITHNTIGDPSAANNITNTGTSYMYGIEIQNNLGTGDTIVISKNTVANLTGTGTGTSVRIRGISFGFTTNVAPLVYIDSNTVHHLSTAGSAVGYGVDQVTALGILAFPSAYHAPSRISNNTVYGIEAANATAVPTISAGICASNFAGDQFNNIIYDIKNKSIAAPGVTTAVTAGIYNRFVSDFRSYNNMISITGSGNSDNVQLNGIFLAGDGDGTHHYSFNTVHIENSFGNSVSSFAFHRGQNALSVASGHPIMLRNNIFSNAVTSAGNHYAIGIEDTTVIVSGASDWNVYKTFNPNTIGSYGTLSYNMADWRARTSNDINTKNVSVYFNAPQTGDLHLIAPSVGDLNLAGVPVANLTTDLDGDIRDLVTPYMGADEKTASPLPVKLVLFTASAVSNDVKLMWATASEMNSNHFVIERSVDGKTFKQVNKVKASGKSDHLISYRQTDANAFNLSASNTLYYRLKMVDNDGSFEYSTIAIVNIKDTKASGDLKVFPNPYNDEAYVEIQASEATTAKITVTDISGKVVITYAVKAEAGFNTLLLQSAEVLKSGIYFISVEMNGTREVTKLIKQ